MKKPSPEILELLLQINEKLAAIQEEGQLRRLMDLCNCGLLRIKIIENGQYHHIPLLEIMHLRADGSYTIIHFKNHAPVTSCRHLGYFDKRLSFLGFARVHDNELVNLRYVTITDLSGDMYLDGKTIIHPSRRGKKNSNGAIQQFGLDHLSA